MEQSTLLDFLIEVAITLSVPEAPVKCFFPSLF
jgi:hypothetical protein